MAFAPVAHTLITPALNGGTTPDIDTTGASLLVIGVSWYRAVTALPSISDSKSNTWVALTKQDEGELSNGLYYAKNPTVGTGHNFTISGSIIAASGFVAAFSGSDTTANADQENGAVATNVVTLATGSVTPSSDNQLVIAAFAASLTPGPFSIDSSFSITDQSGYINGNNEGGALAYLIQTTAGAVNPTFDFNSVNASDAAAVIATFKASGSPPPAGGFIFIGSFM